MPYAVTFRLDDVSAARVAEFWRQLAEEGISQSSLRLGYAPHLTLAIAEDIDVALTTGRLARFATTLPAPRIAFAGIGSFPSPRGVLWAMPAVDRSLLSTHAELGAALAWPRHAHYEVGSWVPHCTLAEDLDADQLGRALRSIAARWQPFAATLDRIELVRFRPVEILWQHPLRSQSAG